MKPGSIPGTGCEYLKGYETFTNPTDFSIIISDLSGCTECLFGNGHPSFIHLSWYKFIVLFYMLLLKLSHLQNG